MNGSSGLRGVWGFGYWLHRGHYKTFGRYHCRQQLMTEDLLWSKERDLFKETETVAREESKSNVIFLEKKSGQGSNAFRENKGQEMVGGLRTISRVQWGKENAGSKQI